MRLQRRDDDLGMAAFFLGGQQGDEGGLQVLRAGLRQQRGGGAGGQHLACVHGHQPVEALGFVHVGGGDQHAHAGAGGADAGDQVPELGAGQRIDAGGRLVQDEQVGVVDQGAAQAQLLLHAAGELARRALQEFLQPGGLGQVVDAPAPLGRVVAEQAGEELQVFLHR